MIKAALWILAFGATSFVMEMNLTRAWVLTALVLSEAALWNVKTDDD